MKIKLKIFYLNYIILFISTLVIYIDSDKTDQLISCSDVPFCERFMFWGDGNTKSLYFINSDSIKIKENTIKGIINTLENNEYNLEFEIFILKREVIRIKIRPINNDISFKKRFELNDKDDVFKMKKKHKNILISKTEENIIVNITKKSSNDIYKLIIEYSPFKIQYFLNNKLIFFLNKNNLFDIEDPNSTELNKTNENECYSTIKIDFGIPNINFFSGLPERRGSSILKDTTGNKNELYHFYNIDVYKYIYNDYNNIYGSIPFLMSNQYNESYIGGIYWNNPSETFISIENDILAYSEDNNETNVNNKKVLFISETGIFDISLLSAKNYDDFYLAMNSYIGKTPIPNIFSLGYHQSRYSYENINDITEIDNKFDEYSIPYDSIWLDVDHTDGQRYFTFNKELFPKNDMKNFLNNLKEKGRKIIYIIDPHIKKDNFYSVYKNANSNGYFMKNKNEENFVGNCWCGDASYLDFSNNDVRNYWKNLIIQNDDYFLSSSIIHIWNDMNEPSVFKIERNTVPKKTIIKYNGIQYEHRVNHNIYGYLMHKTTYKALKNKYKNKIRPFVLTRSFYIGSNKYAGMWTGDNLSDYNSLKDSIAMLISLSISGYSLIGADVGGFTNTIETNLLIRWYQLGVFYPFFRAHSHQSTERREIWLFSKEDFSNMRKSIILKYTILPYIYNQFYLHYETGLPVIKPIWFYEKINELNKGFIDLEFYFGNSLLVKPVISSTEHFNQRIQVYLPEEERWFDFYNNQEILNKKIVDINISKETIGAFVKGGSIIPKKLRLRRSSNKMKDDPISLYIYLNNKNESNGFIYFDDENSFEYKKGNYSLVNINYKNNTIDFKWEKINYNLKNKLDKILIFGLKLNKEITNKYVIYNGIIFNIGLQSENKNGVEYIVLYDFSYMDLKYIQKIVFN